MPELVIEGLVKKFGPSFAIDDVNISVKDGEFFTLLGPSGCGKSTTLASIAGLIDLDAGSIKVGDRVVFDKAKGINLPPERRSLGMVFQSYALWPHMTVEGNVGLPLRIRKTSATVRRAKVAQALEMIGLSAMAGRYPHELSGGQQQRTALARSLAYEPSLLLLDEPLSNLDAKLRDSAGVSLKKIQQQIGVTTVYVTHDQTEALSLSDRIAVMGEGKVLQIGTPTEIYASPGNLSVASFVGRCNFLPGTVRSSSDGSIFVGLDGMNQNVRVELERPITVGQRVTLGIRPEHVVVRDHAAGSTDGNTLAVRLGTQVYVGARFEYHLELGERTIRAEGAAPIQSGEIEVVLPSSQIMVFET